MCTSISKHAFIMCLNIFQFVDTSVGVLLRARLEYYTSWVRMIMFINKFFKTAFLGEPDCQNLKKNH